MKVHLIKYAGCYGLSVCGLLNNEGRKNRANILAFYDKSNFELIWLNEGADALCVKCFEAYKIQFPNAYYNRMKKGGL
jgi:hypothetical protein